MHKNFPGLLIFPVLLILFSVVLVTAEDEEDPMLAAAAKQISAAQAELEKVYRIKLEYEVTPRNVMTLNDVFGFISRIKGVLSDASTTNWPERITSVAGLSIFFKNTDEKDVFIVTETNANATISFNRRDDNFEDLADKLCSEKDAYNKLSEIVRRLKLDLRMGKDVSWARAAVFIRMLDDFMKADKKAARIMKDFTIYLEKKEERKPDYANKAISIPYKMDKERLSARLEDHKKEYEAYKNCRQYEDNLQKLNIVVKYDNVFNEFIPVNFYRVVKELLAKLDALGRNPAYIVKMVRKPIIINDKVTEMKEDAYYISIHAIDAIDGLFK